MKRFYGFTTMVALLVAMLALTHTSAQASTLSQATCTPAMLKGNYQFLAPVTIQVSAGTVVALPEKYITTSPAAYASQGTVSFDEQGHVSLQATADHNGKLSEPMVYDGTYTFNDPCTAHVILANDSTFDVRIVQSQNQQRMVSTTPGFVVSPAR